MEVAYIDSARKGVIFIGDRSAGLIISNVHVESLAHNGLPEIRKSEKG